MLLLVPKLLGSLAMFLYGMSLMSGGLQEMAGKRMRVFMAKMTSNNFKCILTGVVVTAMDFNLSTPLVELNEIIIISQSVIGAKSV